MPFFFFYFFSCKQFLRQNISRQRWMVNMAPDVQSSDNTKLFGRCISNKLQLQEYKTRLFILTTIKSSKCCNMNHLSLLLLTLLQHNKSSIGLWTRGLLFSRVCGENCKVWPTDLLVPITHNSAYKSKNQSPSKNSSKPASYFNWFSSMDGARSTEQTRRGKWFCRSRQHH